jgi:hypothetical protein
MVTPVVLTGASLDPIDRAIDGLGDHGPGRNGALNDPAPTDVMDLTNNSPGDGEFANILDEVKGILAATNNGPNSMVAISSPTDAIDTNPRSSAHTRRRTPIGDLRHPVRIHAHSGGDDLNDFGSSGDDESTRAPTPTTGFFEVTIHNKGDDWNPGDRNGDTVVDTTFLRRGFATPATRNTLHSDESLLVHV